MSTASRLRAWRIVLLGLLVCLAGCAAIPDERARPFGFEYVEPAKVAEPCVVLFFVDGVNSDIFNEMLEAGELPNIQKYFVSRGLYVPRCVANIPSVTMVNETSLVTGLFAGGHGVTGINWFDRNKCIWRDYETIAQKNTLDGDYQAATIFERLKGYTTLSLFYQGHRGATKFVENWTSAGPPFFFGWYQFVDRITLCRFEIVAQIARQRGEFPRLVIAYLLAADMQAYHRGLESAAYRRALTHTDAQIGRVIKDFESQGLLEKLVLVFMSDHGMMPVKKHLWMDKFLRKEVGLKLSRKKLWEDTELRERIRYYRKFPAVLTYSGDRYAGLYLRKPRWGQKAIAYENWLSRPGPEDLHNYPSKNGPVNLVGKLLQQEAVDAVAFSAGPGMVRVVRKDGEVEIRRGKSEGLECSYHLIAGKDPLGYAGKVPVEMLGGGDYSSRAWLEATAGTEFPDLLPQILSYFEAPRAADLVVFAAPGWDLGHKWKAGHGGIRPGEMTFPLIMAGPGIPHGELSTGRAVDVLPTILELLGKQADKNLDGQSLIKKGTKGQRHRGTEAQSR